MKSLVNHLRFSMFAQLIIIYVTLVLFFLMYIYIQENKLIKYQVNTQFATIEAKLIDSLEYIELISDSLIIREKNYNQNQLELINEILFNHHPFDNYIVLEEGKITHAHKPINNTLNHETLNTLEPETVIITHDILLDHLTAIKCVDEGLHLVFIYDNEMLDLLNLYNTKIIPYSNNNLEDHFTKHSILKVLYMLLGKDILTYKQIKVYNYDYLLATTIKNKNIRDNIISEMTIPFSGSLILLSFIYFLIYYRLYYSINKPLSKFVCSFDNLEVIETDTIAIPKEILTYEEFSLIFDHIKRLIIYVKDAYENALTNLNNELKEADKTNKAKTMFLANMSHEMRTPLNSICGYTQLLKRVGFDNQEKVKEYFEGIYTSSELLLQKINDILDLSKIESNEFCLNERPNDLSQIVKEVHDLLKVQAVNKNIDFEYKIDPKIPQYLNIDSTRLKQVLVNLLSNAIKFTDKGQVKLDIELFGYSNEYVILEYTISDTGVGISKDKIDNIFVPFFQACYGKYPQSGTGLGLTIARDLIRLMGGDINVQSKENVGTIFTFITKFKICDIESIENNNQELSNEYITDLLRSKKILVVEDNVINQIFIKEIFSVYNKKDIEIAYNGLEAVEMCKNKLYDLIFMDVQMPVMNGVEATKIIKQMINYNSIPIIALTANAFTEQIKEYLLIGMDDYLLKPLEIKQFKQILAKHLNK